MAQRKYVIPLDGSDQSENAFQWFLDHVHREGDQVILVSVPDDPPAENFAFTYLELAGNAVDEYKNAVLKCHENSAKLLDKYGKRLEERKIDFMTVSKVGKPGEIICDVTDNERATCVVMGSRGLGLIRRTFMGSVSSYVLCHCNAAVTVVPYKQPSS